MAAETMLRRRTAHQDPPNRSRNEGTSRSLSGVCLFADIHAASTPAWSRRLPLRPNALRRAVRTGFRMRVAYHAKSRAAGAAAAAFTVAAAFEALFERYRRPNARYFASLIRNVDDASSQCCLGCFAGRNRRMYRFGSSGFTRNKQFVTLR